VHGGDTGVGERDSRCQASFRERGAGRPVGAVATAPRRLRAITMIARRANRSVRGLAFTDTNASIAWVNASIPVKAVTRAGSDRVSSGSTTAASG